MAVRDSRRDVVVGRDAELARARAVVRARREESQTLLITGPAGIGKTALAEAALIGLDAEILYLRGTPLDGMAPSRPPSTTSRPSNSRTGTSRSASRSPRSWPRDIRSCPAVATSPAP